MPWEKQFDTEAALTAAMHAFWARGYEATSIADLVECMGINRGSLYATFGDKRTLFLQALRRYDAVYRRDWVARVTVSRSPKESILAVFEGAIAAAVESGSRDGCLLVNTALELSPHDDEIAGIVGDSFREMEGFFQAMVEEGRAAGEIPVRVDAADAAAALLSLFVGLRVLSRSRPEKNLLHSIARQAAALVS